MKREQEVVLLLGPRLGRGGAVSSVLVLLCRVSVFVHGRGLALCSLSLSPIYTKQNAHCSLPQGPSSLRYLTAAAAAAAALCHFFFPLLLGLGLPSPFMPPPPPFFCCCCCFCWTRLRKLFAAALASFSSPVALTVLTFSSAASLAPTSPPPSPPAAAVFSARFVCTDWKLAQMVVSCPKASHTSSPTTYRATVSTPVEAQDVELEGGVPRGRFVELKGDARVHDLLHGRLQGGELGLRRLAGDLIDGPVGVPTVAGLEKGILTYCCGKERCGVGGGGHVQPPSGVGGGRGRGILGF